MIDAHNSVTRMRIRELMDVRLRPDLDPLLLPGACWLLSHGFPVKGASAAGDGEYVESTRQFSSHGRPCWVHVTGRKLRKTVRWEATVSVYGKPWERELASGLEPYRSACVDMAVGVQIARLDEALYAYDKNKDKENGDKDS